MFIGIDPGLKGAIALSDGAQRVRVWDMPTHEVRRGRTNKLRIDLHGLSRIVAMLADTAPALAVLEDVGGLPGQSAPAAFNFGWSCGAVAAVLATHGVPYRLVPPAVWKKHYGIRGDKDDAIALANSLFPSHAYAWAATRGNGDAHRRGGRAEAALLSVYAAKIT